MSPDGPTPEVHYKDKKAWKAFFATTLAKVKKQEKKIDAKPEEIDRMSFTISMISLYRRLPKIALMSVELSEKTLNSENSRICTMQRADRIAIASTIKEDPM